MNESFDELVGLNPDVRIEQTSTGELVFTSPSGGDSGVRNAIIIAQLVVWSDSNGGRVFDSSTLFQLPNGAKRSPDASWISESRWEQLSIQQRKGFPPLCPDLVFELRSESDRLIDLQEKMNEYMANGAELGWLVDPLTKVVHVYRAGRVPEVLSQPATVSDENLFPGLVLELSRIWIER